MMRLRELSLVGLVTMAVLLGCEQPNEYAPPPPPEVTVAKPKLQDVQSYFHTVGQTRAVNRVELRARVSGYLDSVHFQDGDVVQQGQPLFTIDRAPYEAALESAEAALAKAKANLQLAQQQLARTRTLVDRQAVSDSELDRDVAEQASAAADVKAGEAAVREAQLNLNYTEVRAPFTGQIGRRRVDPGNLVQPGETMLAILESIDPIHAYFTVSESELLRFLDMQRSGELSVKENDQIQVQLAVGDSGKYAFEGHIDFREFGIDPDTGTTERRAVFPNANTALRPGLYVQVRIPVGPPASRLLIEERAVGADQRGDYVLVVNSEKKVEYRKVELGDLYGTTRVILDGLGAEERIVVEGLQRARPGIEVQPDEAEAHASSSSPKTASAEPDETAQSQQ